MSVEVCIALVFVRLVLSADTKLSASSVTSSVVGPTSNTMSGNVSGTAGTKL